MAEATIQKWGNSPAIRIPAATLKALDLRVGQALTLSVENGALVAKPAQRRYSLAELVAQCKPKAAMPADLLRWERMPPCGNEIL